MNQKKNVWVRLDKIHPVHIFNIESFGSLVEIWIFRRYLFVEFHAPINKLNHQEHHLPRL